jgi:eukaryotic-like serine/threonine-protein kinase
MSSEKFAKAGEIFDSALALSLEERSAYLKGACGEDELLFAEVQSLLAAHDQAKGFMQAPAFQNVELTPVDEQLSAGEQIGAYKIIRQIGRGGMGAVYLAERADQQFKKHVAIKLVKRGMDTDYILRHFRNERQILATFDHPNIARLLDGGSTESGLPYFVMEFVEGTPIDQYCDEKQINISQRLLLFQQVCAAVAYAHRNLVIHRDIKPSNIIVSSDGVPKLLDFGIAKIMQSDEAGVTATGVHLMTPEFASPEQAQGQTVTTLTDVYSLGVVLYELLTGHSPYDVKSRTPIEIARIITETQPVLPSTKVVKHLRRRLQGDLDNIVLMSLRKEPQRRYQSVDQLSDDIRRHLQGMPIAAHKDTIVYRASRFVLRNRMAVGIVVLSLLTLALFGSMMQWRANKQAKLFQEFGQEVTRIEAFMRYAYLLPLHNIERDKKQVTDRLDYIKKRMEVMGTISYGAGYYSLGKGYLSLHRYQDAYDNLILAWQKYGYREPLAANALGLSLAMLYQQKMDEAEQVYNKEQKKQRKMELEKQYRLPAVQYIQKGANVSESPEYVQAIVAFLGKQYPDALNKARVAEEEISWHYESIKLQGDIFLAMANEQADVGSIDKSLELYQKAKVAYQEAAKKGESDPQIYDALCLVQSEIHTIQIELERKSSKEVIDEGIKYCKNALQLDSKDINANLTASRIFKDQAFYEASQGNDPSGAVEDAINFANAALKIDSENALAHIAKGEAYSARSDWEIFRGRDPLPFLNVADESFAKALKKLPEDPQLMYLMANNSWKRAQFESVQGKDPRSSLDKSIGLLRKTTKLNRQNYKLFTTLGQAYYVKGEYEVGIGLDPSNSYNSSIENLKQSMMINPNYLVPYIWCGNSYMGMADYYVDVGKDPNQSLDDAISVFQKSVLIDPKYSWAYAGMGIALSRKGLALHEKRQDPSAALEMSRQAFKKSIELDPSIVSIYAYFADEELIGARDAMLHQKSPEPFLKESEQILKSCFNVNKESDECLASLAAGNLVRAEYLTSSVKSAEPEIVRGIKNADHAIKVNSGNAPAMAYRGKLYLIRAQSSSGSSRKQNALQAVESFNKAFQIDKTLRREFKKHAEQAQQLSES